MRGSPSPCAVRQEEEKTKGNQKNERKSACAEVQLLVLQEPVDQDHCPCTSPPSAWFTWYGGTPKNGVMQTNYSVYRYQRISRAVGVFPFQPLTW